MANGFNPLAAALGTDPYIQQANLIGQGSAEEEAFLMQMIQNMQTPQMDVPQLNIGRGRSLLAGIGDALVQYGGGQSRYIPFLQQQIAQNQQMQQQAKAANLQQESYASLRKERLQAKIAALKGTTKQQIGATLVARGAEGQRRQEFRQKLGIEEERLGVEKQRAEATAAYQRGSLAIQARNAQLREDEFAMKTAQNWMDAAANTMEPKFEEARVYEDALKFNKDPETQEPLTDHERFIYARKLDAIMEEIEQRGDLLKPPPGLGRYGKAANDILARYYERMGEVGSPLAQKLGSSTAAELQVRREIEEQYPTETTDEFSYKDALKMMKDEPLKATGAALHGLRRGLGQIIGQDIGPYGAGTRNVEERQPESILGKVDKFVSERIPGTEGYARRHPGTRTLGQILYGEPAEGPEQALDTRTQTGADMAGAYVDSLMQETNVPTPRRAPVIPRTQPTEPSNIISRSRIRRIADKVLRRVNPQKMSQEEAAYILNNSRSGDVTFEFTIGKEKSDLLVEKALETLGIPSREQVESLPYIEGSSFQ
jgi:hypothetical protein